ncbi:MAG: aminoacyl-tRNA hydrolase [Candidatus Cloacimonadota bacterium]|nr:aminoacyl-tRNA hydrolase [Candidatus Cloacimonadota bacterium]
MKLIVGLGNPGNKYRENRHNIGFKILDYIRKKNDLKEKRTKNYNYYILDDAVFIKPKTYINLSGNAVISALSKHDIDDILVCVDDINLPLGTIRLRLAGGSGGHNGLKSIINKLGSNDFKRLRLGVGAPTNSSLTEYVLGNFSQSEKKIVEIMLEFCKKLISKYLESNYTEMLNLYSKNIKSYSEKIKQLRIERPKEVE